MVQSSSMHLRGTEENVNRSLGENTANAHRQLPKDDTVQKDELGVGDLAEDEVVAEPELEVQEEGKTNTTQVELEGQEEGNTNTTPAGDEPQPNMTSTSLPTDEQVLDLVSNVQFVVATNKDTESSLYSQDLQESMDLLVQDVAKSFSWLEVNPPSYIDGVIPTSCPDFVDESQRCENVSVSIGLFLYGNRWTGEGFDNALESAIADNELQSYLDNVNTDSAAWIVTGTSEMPSSRQSPEELAPNLKNESKSPDEGDNKSVGLIVAIACLCVAVLMLMLVVFFQRRQFTQPDKNTDKDDRDLGSETSSDDLNYLKNVGGRDTEWCANTAERKAYTNMVGTAITAKYSLDSYENYNDQAFRENFLISDLDALIQQGNWSGVGVTAALMASSSFDTMSIASSTRTPMLKNNIDPERAAELDRLIQAGDWEGILRTASRYDAEESTPTRCNKEKRSDLLGQNQKSFDSLLEYAQDDAPSANMGSTGSAWGGWTTCDDSTSGDSTGGGSTGGGGSVSFGGGSTGANSTGGDSTAPSVGTTTSERLSRQTRYAEIKKEIEKLVQQIVPDENENIDEMVAQFSGREEELLETLRTLKERFLAQKLHVASQKKAQLDAKAIAAANSDRSDPVHTSTTKDNAVASDGQDIADGGEEETSAAAELAVLQSFSNKSDESNDEDDDPIFEGEEDSQASDV